MYRPSAIGAKKDIGDVLRERAYITGAQLEAARRESASSGRSLAQVLVDQGAVSQEAVAKAVVSHLGVLVVDLRSARIDAAAVRLVPERLARELHVMPISLRGDTLRAAMEDPSDVAALEVLAAVTGKRIQPVLPAFGGIGEAIDAHYRPLTHWPQREGNGHQREESLRRQPQRLIDAKAIASAPTVRALDIVLEQAVANRASDVHIEPFDGCLRIRYRIDGVLHDAADLPLWLHAALLSRLENLARMSQSVGGLSREGEFTRTVGHREVDFRVTVTQSTRGEKAVVRVLDREALLPQMSELGFQPGVLDVYRRLLCCPSGMILVSGPKGSGRSTTLYSSIVSLDREQNNVMTIEDPVEHGLEGVYQTQVDPGRGVTFASGLRAIMRMDPNVILVGDIRDTETAQVAVEAALDGQLVLASIHAEDSACALGRLMDLGVAPFLVTTAVIGSVAQRLLRKVCPYCRRVVSVTAEEAVAYQREMTEVRTSFYHGRGCEFCFQTGFLGRTGVFEVLVVSEQVRHLVARGASAAEIRTVGVQQGMTTMRRDGMLKARDGIVTPGEVVRQLSGVN